MVYLSLVRRAQYRIWKGSVDVCGWGSIQWKADRPSQPETQPHSLQSNHKQARMHSPALSIRPDEEI
jgi:hypothetical protein